MNLEALRALPKVELHNHLDGGLRVATVLELADEIGYTDLPANDPQTLAAWFYQGESGSLESYLAGFTHTIAVMQTASAISRVAYEAVADLAADGVIYAEIRFAPLLNTRHGMSREDVIEAALDGFARGRRDFGVPVGLIVDAMRDIPDSLDDARAAIRFVGKGVVGFDLAGPEAGFPADDHLPACRLVREHGLGLTIHAGEADGPDSIHRAIAKCGATRIGHGVRIADDLTLEDGAVSRSGSLAALVRDRRIPLEICPTSNLHTLGISASQHPLGLLYDAGFNVTLNTDNRLMSNVTLTDEFAVAVEHHGFQRSDLERTTRAALDAAFLETDLRKNLHEVVSADYAS